MDQISSEVISSPLHLKFCRVCLVKDTKMLCLYKDCLKQEFFDVTGLQISTEYGWSHYICYICCALLKKATNFRNRCHNSQKILAKQAVTQDFLKRINLTHETLLKRTNIVIFSSMDNDHSDKTHCTEIKEETKENVVDYENDNNFDHLDDQSVVDETSLNVCEENKSVEDFSYRDENIDEKNKLIEAKKNKRSKTYIENLNSPNNLFHLPTDRLNKLNKRTQDKYRVNTKHKNAVDEETDSEDDFKPLSSYTTVNTDNNPLIISKNHRKQDNINKSHHKNKKNNKISVKEEAKLKKDKDTIKSKKEVRIRETIDKFDKTYNCKVVALSREEQIEVVKARAENKKYKYGKFKCDDCYTGFVVESKFVCHRKSHDPAISGDIECEICHVRFKTRLQYMKHTLRHKYKYICKECGAVSFSRSFAKNHYEFHAGTKYECQYCDQVFSKYATRINHVRNKHGSAECTVCHDLLGPGGLALHLSLAHRQTYKCSSCDRVFNDPEALRRHMRSPSDAVCDPEMRPCTRCGETFKIDDVDLFNKHIEEHRESKKRKRKFTDILDRKGTSKNVVASKHEDKLNCVASDRDVSNGVVKNKRRGGEKTKLMCEICALDNFKNITALRYHQRIHTGEKPHQCPTCPKRFRLTHTLQWHIRTHTGDRPYACSECPKAFKTNTALCRHKLVHTNERRHVCNLCGKAFQTSTNVKLHVRTVHMKIPMPPRIRNRKKRVEEPRVTTGDMLRHVC